jgi:sarcosine oxidase subunit beta
MPHIVVIGGGISGTAAACELARAGHTVTLVEKGGLASMASGWTLGGVRQSGRDPAELPLAKAAVARWGDLAEELGADVEYRRHGNLRLARNPDEVPVIRDLVASQRAQGLDLAYLPDNAAVRAVAPALSERILAASFCPSDGHANPVKSVQAFAAAASRHGAVIREGVAATRIAVAAGRLTGVETSDGFVPAGRVVVAAGVHAPDLLEPLGLALPLTIRMVTVVQTVPLEPCLTPVIGVANAECAGRQEADGRLRVSTGIDDWPHPAGARDERALAPTVMNLHMLIHRIGAILPAFNSAGIARMWAGLIDLTPDGLPVIVAPGEVEGLVIAAGFSGHGFCLGPVTGELVADLALGRPPRHDLAAFRLDRFAGRADAPAALTLHG